MLSAYTATWIVASIFDAWEDFKKQSCIKHQAINQPLDDQE